MISRVKDNEFADFNYDEGDVILYVAKDGEILASELAESVTGEITAIRGGEVRIDGVYYKDVQSTKSEIGDDGTFYLNKAGQIVDSEASSTNSDNYAYIYSINEDNDISADGLSGTPTYTAYMVLADGTKAVSDIDVDIVDEQESNGLTRKAGTYFADSKQTVFTGSGESKDFFEGVIAYSVNGDDELVYEDPADNVVGFDQSSDVIDKDHVLFGNGFVDGENKSVRATSSTQFIFAYADGSKMEVSLATGYRNVSIAKATDKYVVADDDGYALYVFVNADNGTLSSDEAVFVLLDDDAVFTREDGDNYYTYTVYADGQETELTWKGSGLSGAEKGGVYTYKMDGDYVKADSVEALDAVKVVATNNDYVIVQDGKNSRYDWDTATVYTITVEYKKDNKTIDSVSVYEGGAVEADDQVYYTVDGDDLDLVFVIDEIK